MAGQFTKWFITAPPLDGPGHPLRQQQPPRNHIAVPGVDDHLDFLVQQIPLHQPWFGRHHSFLAKTRLIASATASA